MKATVKIENYIKVPNIFLQGSTNDEAEVSDYCFRNFPTSETRACDESCEEETEEEEEDKQEDVEGTFTNLFTNLCN